MQKAFIGLSALALTAAATTPGLAQDTIAAIRYPAACGEYVAEYLGCLDYSDLPETQAGPDLGHPQSMERQAATRFHSREIAATADRAAHASRIARRWHR